LACCASSSCRQIFIFLLTLAFVPSLLGQSNPLGYDYVTTETLNTSGQDRPLAYDPNLHIVYVVEPQMNRIDAISVASHSIVRTIDVPQPTSVDVSADGTKLIIGTNTAYFFTADAVAGVLTGRFTFVLPVLNQPNTTQQIAPVGVTYLTTQWMAALSVTWRSIPLEQL
jgi:hypothetical protein